MVDCRLSCALFVVCCSLCVVSCALFGVVWCYIVADV